MAQMTRADFRTELQNRGWSRYAAADLDRYLDWGLRDVVREAKWKDTHEIEAISAHSTPYIAFSSINSGNVRSILAVICTSDNDERKLMPEDEQVFLEHWLGVDKTESSAQGAPTRYFIHQDRVYLILAPDQAYDFDVHYIQRITAFTGDGATSGLPERFDEAILPAAEAYCFRRAHEFDRMGVAQIEMRRIVLSEMVDDGERMMEESGRVIPYR